jgi:hypothetical protein
MVTSKEPRRARATAPDIADAARVVRVTRIRLADGKDYELEDVGLNMLIEFEREYPDGDALELVATGKMQYIRYLIYLRLRKGSPELTPERVGELVTLPTILALRLS